MRRAELLKPVNEVMRVDERGMPERSEEDNKG